MEKDIDTAEAGGPARPEDRRDAPDEASVKPLVGENMVLSNRDKSQHAKKGDRDRRGLDGKWVETEQMQDHDANKLREDK